MTSQRKLIRFLNRLGIKEQELDIDIWMQGSKGAPHPVLPYMLFLQDSGGRKHPSFVTRRGTLITFIRLWARPDGFRVEVTTRSGAGVRRGRHSLRTLKRAIVAHM